MSNYEREYRELFDYLSAPELPNEAHGVLVFGRQDPLVAETAGQVALDGIGDFIVISGGIGKDSGNLQEPEAVYLEKTLLTFYPDLTTPVYTETKATNGGENVRNSLALMDKLSLPYQAGLITVAHATSARRLSEMAKHEAAKRETPIESVYRVPTNYNFAAENPADQNEALAEMARLIEWPAKGWLGEQVDLPQNLIDFVNDQR